MILQLMIRRPDEELKDSTVIGINLTERDCVDSIALLLKDKVSKKIATSCFSYYPSGFFIEGVAYGELEQEPIDAYDLELRVLH